MEQTTKSFSSSDHYVHQHSPLSLYNILPSKLLIWQAILRMKDEKRNVIVTGRETFVSGVRKIPEQSFYLLVTQLFEVRKLASTLQAPILQQNGLKLEGFVAFSTLMPHHEQMIISTEVIRAPYEIANCSNGTKIQAL